MPSPNNSQRLKFQCTYTTQIRKKRNRVYKDGKILININSQKITVFDDRNLVVDAKFFQDMSNEEFHKLEGESLTFEKCFVDVLEELDINTGEVKHKVQLEPTKVTKKKRKKRKKPLVRMANSSKSIYDVVAEGKNPVSSAAPSPVAQSPPPSMKKNTSFYSASRRSTSVEDNMDTEEDDAVMAPPPSYQSSRTVPQRRSTVPQRAPPTFQHTTDVRSDDALLALLKGGRSSGGTPSRPTAQPQHKKTPAKRAKASSSSKFKSAFFDDVLQEDPQEKPLDEMLDEEEGVVIGASSDVESDEEPLLIKKNTASRRTLTNRSPSETIVSSSARLEKPVSRPPSLPPQRKSLQAKSGGQKRAEQPNKNSANSHHVPATSTPTPNLPPQKRTSTSPSESAFDIITNTSDTDEDMEISRPTLKKKRKSSSPSLTTPVAPEPQPKRRRLNDSGISTSSNDGPPEGVEFGASHDSSSDEEIAIPRMKKRRKGNFMPPARVNKPPPASAFSVEPHKSTKRSPPPSRFKPPATSTPAVKTDVLSVVKRETGTTLSLHFPGPEILDYNPGANFERHCQIPDSFSSVEEYSTTFLHALYEEMNLQLFQLAHRFRSLYNQITNENSRQAQAPLCKTCHQRTQIRSVKKNNQNHGRLYYSCSKKGCNYFVSWVDATNKTGNAATCITDKNERRSFFRKHDIPFYHECELSRSTKQSPDKPQWYLVLGEKEKSSNYGMDDIWIISYSDEFSAKYGVLIARGLYHAPGTDGLLEVEIIAGNPRKVGRSRGIHAIRGPNFSSELQVIENIKTMDPHEMPFINELLGHLRSDDRFVTPKETQFPAKVDPAITQAKVESTIETHSLNEGQSEVLRQCAKWFETGDTSENIMLVHGAFGAGKSFLLTVLITFICELMDEIGDEHVRILISSVTNVAVDNILRGLVDLGFTDFIRVGSQQKIARDLLPYTIASDKSKNAQIKDLKKMLKEDMPLNERSSVKQRIADLKSGRQKERESQAGSVRVVGVTCAASGFEVLKSTTFPIIIQDESSQCLEPLALLPIARFKCEKLIAVGDPLQLPPTLVGGGNSKDEQNEDTLAKTLFVRLANVGFQPLMLRTQYRCHPMISQLSNAMFYGQELQDGISEEEREPLIPYMPPVTVIDTFSGRETFSRGSYHNESEAVIILHMIDVMTKKYGIDPEQIGVISLYKPQAFKIAEQLKQKSLRRIKVSTVDAFQGGEKDIVFLSCVRTSNNVNAFLESKKRLNVAITRAKRHLVIVGKQSLLQQSSLWRTIIGQAKRMNGVYPTSQILTMEDFSIFERNTILEKSIDEDDDDILDEDLTVSTGSRRRSNNSSQQWRYNLPPLVAPQELLSQSQSMKVTRLSEIREKKRQFKEQSQRMLSEVGATGILGRDSTTSQNTTLNIEQHSSPSGIIGRSSIDETVSHTPPVTPIPSAPSSGGKKSSSSKKSKRRVINFDDDDDVIKSKSLSRIIEDDDSDDDLLEDL